MRLPIVHALIYSLTGLRDRSRSGPGMSFRLASSEAADSIRLQSSKSSLTSIPRNFQLQESSWRSRSSYSTCWREKNSRNSYKRGSSQDEKSLRDWREMRRWGRGSSRGRTRKGAVRKS